MGSIVRSGRLPAGPGPVRGAGRIVAARAAAASARSPATRVLDLCASPGGKTTALAAEMDGRGLVVACDARARRMRLLADTVRESGAPNVRLVQVGSRDDVPFRPVFDRVLVDAPCSGLGTVRRDPDIRWRRTEAQLTEFAAAQRLLLDRAARAVAPGGRLVYATCSSEPEENEAVVDAFLAAHAEFSARDRARRPARRRRRRARHAANAAVPARARGVLRRRPRPIVSPRRRTGTSNVRGTISRSCRSALASGGSGKFLLLAGALGLTFLVFFGIAMRAALQGARGAGAGPGRARPCPRPRAP